MFAVPTFSIPGVVTEARELTSQKNASWRGYVCKVAALGATFELNIADEKTFAQIGAGLQATFKGRFEPNTGGGGVRFMLVEIEKPKS